MINQAKPQVATIETLRKGLVPISSKIAVDAFAQAWEPSQAIYIVVDWEGRATYFTVAQDQYLSHLDIQFEGTLFNLDFILCPFDYFEAEIGYYEGYSASYEECLHNYIMGKARAAQDVFDSALATDDESVIRSRINKILCPYEDYYNLVMSAQQARRDELALSDD